ncbi:MAG: PSD1 and planctomycete cytochrome C domain-containing protein [Planctomycetota bacterium]|nr:PSD1 and planctomycete cytochrome C domain-containing protein [Planctomycetota bacterium]MDA1214914.1 PSD1 and planctomycete cytochrome C domain-containing protein [Planctomycetota bacterium]
MKLRLLLLFFLVSVAGSARADEPVDFVTHIQPIFAKHCLSCHGADAQESGLRLDHRDITYNGGDSGKKGIVPGKSAESELMHRLTTDDISERMPPEGDPLSVDEIGLITRWIDSGAQWPESLATPKLANLPWSYFPPQRPIPPPASDPSWPRNSVDNFVLSKLDAAGLTPTFEADRYVLIRRVSLDLIGLPPSPDEVAAFVNDDSPDAYERLVDRLLASPAYGERWARMWLDLARYADSAGYGSDPLRTIWGYRDWVIDAFNDNKSFDRFTIEQIAGDLLPDATLETQIATGFHRNTMTNTEGGTDDEEWRTAAVKDRVDTTMQVWMGLTFGCAKCHSHKYEPITQREYYEFYAFFNQTADNDQPSEAPVVSRPSQNMIEQNQAIDAQIAELKKELEAATDKKSIEDKIAELEKTRPVYPTIPVLQELAAEQRRETHVLIKGNYLSPGDIVEPQLPSALPSFPEGVPQNRLGVATWLVDKGNPLTARVMVNRYWSQLFGAGLVETEEDFGVKGELPSHPELLDWLATEFMRLDWDMKAMLRVIVTSATYRQSSRVTSIALEKDARNRLYSRGPRHRLEAEMVRDQALALSGLLGEKVGGPSVYPPQPPGMWQAAFNGQRTWPTSEGLDRYRRGLYVFWRRTVPYPSMATFDAPSREICTVRRIRTNTPLQAFVTMNDPVYVETSQALARRIIAEGGETTESRIQYALELCLCRPAQPEQIAAVQRLYESEKTHYAQNQTAATQLATDPLGPLPEGADTAEYAAWTVIGNILLNMDGVLMKQ